MQKVNIFLVILGLSACRSGSKTDYSAISYSKIERDIMVLSADSMQGRAPFTLGEQRAVSYIEGRMKGIGLEPLFNGSYRQGVPMVSITSHLPTEVPIKTKNETLALRLDDDICLWSPTTKSEVRIDNVPLIFAGFGISTPEYEWNDFKGMDVKGKVIVVLVNDPGYYLRDSSFFKGIAMTYYGRWTYKFEEAERQGALNCIIVHEDGPAGYPWSVAGSKSNSSILYLDSPELENPKCLLNGWITHNAAVKLFERCGFSYDDIKQSALKKDFKSIELKAKLELTVKNTSGRSVSSNIAGYIKGSVLPDEFVVYTAHWDHLGIGRPINGDSIYNGASDNAAAVAWMLAIANAFKKNNPNPERSVIFLSPTAEESGLLGSMYFAKNCPFDVSKGIACINYDVVLFLGRFNDVTLTGYGHSNLDSLLAVVAGKHKRYIDFDPNPENGMFYRSDQLPFLKVGIPAVFAKGYTYQVDLGRDKTRELINRYWKNTYHKPSDEYTADRDKLNGVVDDAVLFYDFGWQLSKSSIYPKWYKKSEFYC